MTSKVSLNTQESQSVRNESRYIYKWTISDFDSKSAAVGENLPSTKLDFTLEPDMHFEGELKIKSENSRGKQCILVLNCTNQDIWSVCCNLCIGKEPSTITEAWHLTQDLTFRESVDISECMVSEDINVITCEIVHVFYEQIENPTLFPIKESKLKSDMVDLFTSKQLSDVTFVVKGDSFRAHKCILSARSEKFAAMFKLDTQEEKVIINHSEPRVFYEVLRFIYTDEILDLEIMPSRLLVESNKYDLEDLKTICENVLANKISIESAAETLIIADSNEAKELKKHAMDFVKQNSKAVAATLGWQKIVAEHMHLLAELYSHIVQ